MTRKLMATKVRIPAAYEVPQSATLLSKYRHLEALAACWVSRPTFFLATPSFNVHVRLSTIAPGRVSESTMK